MKKMVVGFNIHVHKISELLHTQEKPSIESDKSISEKLGVDRKHFSYLEPIEPPLEYPVPFRLWEFFHDLEDLQEGSPLL